ncbi:MAG: fatty acid hydroxylase, partial [Proteobacteria bacterium]
MSRQPYVSKVRLFKSDFLERFTHVNPIMPLIIWAPVVVYLYWH